MKNFQIERATLQEMDFILAWAKAEGWNPGLSDGVPFYHTDPQGFFIGKIDGEPIGCISAVTYENNYGFLGFYIVIPKYRGKGYGIQLWRHAMSYLEGKTIGLDGVVAQQKNYEKSGFKFCYNNMRMGGQVQGKFSNELEPITKSHFQTLIDYDAPIFGAKRALFLNDWFQMPLSLGFVKMTQKGCKGYGWIRQCGVGYKIGPLYADDYPTAKEIFLALAFGIDHGEIFLDVPQINAQAIQLAEEHHLKQVFQTARMYRGLPPKQDLKKVFGVSTFELG